MPGPAPGPALQFAYTLKGLDFATAGEAAGKIKKTLQQIGFSPSVIRRAAIVAYEAEMNVVIHARQGELRATITPGRIELVIEDEGPGIADIERAMQEGYSTAPDFVREMGFGAGMGLPNMRKSANEFTLESTVGKGTKIRAIIKGW